MVALQKKNERNSSISFIFGRRKIKRSEQKEKNKQNIQEENKKRQRIEDGVKYRKPYKLDDGVLY